MLIWKNLFFSSSQVDALRSSLLAFCAFFAMSWISRGSRDANMRSVAAILLEKNSGNRLHVDIEKNDFSEFSS